MIRHKMFRHKSLSKKYYSPMKNNIRNETPDAETRPPKSP